MNVFMALYLNYYYGLWQHGTPSGYGIRRRTERIGQLSGEFVDGQTIGQVTGTVVDRQVRFHFDPPK